MNYIKKIVSILLWNSLLITQTPQLTDLSNTTILKNRDLTQKILSHFGFEKIYFTTSDNYKLCGLFLDQSKTHKEQIKGTIIFTAGFYPGTKEGIASFYQMFANLPYNFFFFDARCHNESEGRLISYHYLKNYGQYEHRDISAAIKYLERYNQEKSINPNIFLLGLCSGAYHSVKSAYDLSQTNPQTYQRIKGIIFDSGWNSINEIAEPIIAAELHKRLKDSYLYILFKPLSWLLTGIYKLFFKTHHEQVNSINEIIQHIECPILFIHSQQDKHISIEPVKNIASYAKKPTCWWANSESHGTCHLKHQPEYIFQVQQFLDQV